MTFSIVAHDAQSGQVGIAITTSSIAVGSRCPWVRSGVGAAATQNITDPALGNAVLDLIEQGASASEAISATASAATHIEYRQLTAVDASGNVGHFTGSNILGVHAVATGAGCVAAGNLLADVSVPAAMVRRMESRDRSAHLAQSLIESLDAGIAAGGEEGDVHSAALLVASVHGWPEVDLRVDWDDADPVARLRSLWMSFAPQREDYLLRAVSPDKAPSYGVPGDP